MERVRRPLPLSRLQDPRSAPRCATPSTTEAAGPSPCSASALPRGSSPLETASSVGRRNCARRTSPSWSTTRGSSSCPGSRSPTWARHILAIVRRRLPGDWTGRYNTTPVLIETFVETPRYTGAVYRASGWTHVGTTQGRGRYDRYTRRAQPKKDIWLRPLKKNWKRTLNSYINPPSRPGRTFIGQGLACMRGRFNECAFILITDYEM